jgi:methionyl-tRNA formyltransferase
MDAGDIISQREYPLDGTETTASLTEAVALAAAPELVRAAGMISRGEAAAVPQDESKATYCRIILKEDGFIDWSMPAGQIEKMVRAYIPWPKTRTSLNPETLVILESSELSDNDVSNSEPRVPGEVLGVDKSRGILIQTGSGILAVTRLQLASRKPLDFRSFLNGVKLEPGTILGESS